MAKMRVYLAGPITLGDPILNVRAAVLAGQQLLEAGYAPYVPHLACFWHFLCPNPYDAWIGGDLEWLACAQAVVRLPGVSKGADIEVTRARELGIPVYMGVEAFLEAQRAADALR